jgi:hypothetical protein
MTGAELGAWIQTQKDNVAALYKPGTVKSVELFYDKTYVPTDGGAILPPPQTPPGVAPSGDKGLDNGCYRASTLEQAGQIANELLRNAGPGAFVLLMRDLTTGQYWVDGAYPEGTIQNDMIARYPDSYRVVDVKMNDRIIRQDSLN